MNSPNPKGALKGVKVVESCTYTSAPYAAKVLGDLGADVIKVENKFTGGDYSRSAGAPFIDGVASYLQTLNAGKKCVTINVKDPRGIKLFYDLLRDADIFIDNRPVGVSEELGIGWEQLHEINPGLIVCRVTGFGMTDSKFRDYLAFDPIFQSVAGLLMVTGAPGTPPTKCGVAIADLAGSLWTVSACLAALLYKRETGKGQLIDFSLADGMLGVMENNVNTYTFSKKPPLRMGNSHVNIAPLNAFQTSDGWIFISCGTNGHANAVADAVGHPEWKENPEYGSNLKRVANREWIEAGINEWAISHTTEECCNALAGKAPIGPVYDMEQAYNSRYFHGRDMIVEVEHPTIGKIEILGSPLSHMSETPAVVDKCCGPVSCDNEEIFKGLGLSDEELALYTKENVI